MRHSLITPRISSAEEKTKLIVDKTTTIRQSLRWNDMMYMTKRQNNNKTTKSKVERHSVDKHIKTKQQQNTKSSAHCVFWRRITAVLWYVVERAGVPWQMQLNYLLARIKIYLLAKITGNTEQCDKNSKGEDNIRRWRILLLREVVSKGRRKESKGCHETHERERRESLGGAIVRNHFSDSVIESWAVWGDFACCITLGDCTCVLTWSPCRGRCRTRWGRCARKSSRTESS